MELDETNNRPSTQTMCSQTRPNQVVITMPDAVEQDEQAHAKHPCKAAPQEQFSGSISLDTPIDSVIDILNQAYWTVIVNMSSLSK